MVERVSAKARARTAAKAKARTAAKAKARTAAGRCGMWGHTAKICKQKDTNMEERRGLWSQGASAIGQEPWAIESSEHAQEGLAALDNPALHTWRELGGFELECLLKQNRFAAIAGTSGGKDDDWHARNMSLRCKRGFTKF